MKCGLLSYFSLAKKMNRKMRSRQKASVSYRYGLPTSTIFIFERSTEARLCNCSAKQPSPHDRFVDNPFIMSALVPRVGTGMSVQSQMSSSGRTPSGRTPSGSALACNRCSKPLATTCFLCSCDCIFCEGKFYTSFFIHINFVGA